MNEHSVNVNGNDYYLKQFKGEKAFLIKLKIAPIITKALKAIQKDVSDEASETDILVAIGSVVDSIFADLDPEKTLALVKDVLSETYKGNYKVDFDKEFCGNQSAIYKLIFEVIKLNYPDLFQMLGIDVTNL